MTYEEDRSGDARSRADARKDRLRRDEGYRAAWRETLSGGQYTDFERYWAFEETKWFERHLDEVDRRKDLLGILESYAPFADRRVLVVGSGHGAEWVALAERGARVYGLDLETHVTRFAALRARAHGREPAFLLGDALRPPFREETFDWVFLRQIVEHVPRALQEPFLVATARLVRPGGHVYLDTPNQWDPIDRHDSGLPLVHWLPGPLRRVLVRLLGREVPTLEPSAGGIRVTCHDFPSPRGLRRSLARAGRFQRRSFYKEFPDLDAWCAFRARQGRRPTFLRSSLLRVAVNGLGLGLVTPIHWVLQREGGHARGSS